MRQHQISTQTFNIVTQYGDMLVVKQGIQQQQHHHHHHHSHHHPLNNSMPSGSQQSSASADQQVPASGTQPTRPIIMTFHDLGLNSELQFASFCECEEVKLMLQTFTIIHVNFIGQEFDSKGQPVASLPDDFKYPTVEQMAECIVDICAQLRVRSFVGLAVGAGAHIVSTLALIRPDLVHGLFLINPIISSCSITEWLYFKMSAIAGNHHQILSGSGHHHGHHHSHHHGHHHSHHHGHHHHGQAPQDTDQQHHSPDGHHHHHFQKLPSSGLKKLWNAVHHHHHNQHQYNTASKSICPSLDSTQSTGSGATTEENEGDAHPKQESQSSPPSSTDQPSTSQPSTPSTSSKPAASSRLRQLILSRNFRVGKHTNNQQQAQHSQSSTPMRTCNTSMSSLSIDTTSEHNSTSTPASTSGEPRSLEEHPIGREPRASPGPRRASNAADSQVRPPAGRRPSGSSQLSTSSTQSSGNKRPPFEYLMYHHFGTTSLQRFRRLSDVPAPNAIVGAQSSSTASGDSDLAAKVQELRKELAQHRNSCDSSTSGQSARSHNRASSEVGGARPQAASQDSLSRRARSSSASHRLQRSNSVCLSASYLASISSDRQRATYMQMVYRQYFSQLNSHNLWMFAQSFVKRRTLNLRKDCGAAAHAAAAAAALGTSICAAFVGVGPPSQCALGVPSPSPDLGTSVGAATAHHQQALEQQSSSRSSRSSTSQQLQAPATKTTPKHDSSGEHRATQQHTKCHSGRHPTTKTASTRSASKEQPRQQALVAGTKVKRTFTCQTLIMCSSVHIHRERAVKLMSLLNPLQATWIKTDQLLVLEEKPEKVCQALRLFLQGIGYSMSTYERRLRLSSAQTSVSSAESNGSARSLNMEPALASTTSQSLPKPSSGSLQQKMST